MRWTITRGDKVMTDEETREYLNSPKGMLLKFQTRRIIGCFAWAVGIAAFLFVMLLWGIELVWR